MNESLLLRTYHALKNEPSLQDIFATNNAQHIDDMINKVPDQADTYIQRLIQDSGNNIFHALIHAYPDGKLPPRLGNDLYRLFTPHIVCLSDKRIIPLKTCAYNVNISSTQNNMFTQIRGYLLNGYQLQKFTAFVHNDRYTCINNFVKEYINVDLDVAWIYDTWQETYTQHPDDPIKNPKCVMITHNKNSNDVYPVESVGAKEEITNVISNNVRPIIGSREPNPRQLSYINISQQDFIIIVE